MAFLKFNLAFLKFNFALLKFNLALLKFNLANHAFFWNIVLLLIRFSRHTFCYSKTISYLCGPLHLISLSEQP